LKEGRKKRHSLGSRGTTYKKEEIPKQRGGRKGWEKLKEGEVDMPKYKSHGTDGENAGGSKGHEKEGETR